MPLAVTLRVDPFEHSVDAHGYPLDAGEWLWAIQPAAAILQVFVETLDDVPPLKASTPAPCSPRSYKAAMDHQDN